MKCLNKRLLLLAIIIVFSFCLTSCGSNTNQETTGDRPVVIVGSEDYPPFISMDSNGDPSGLDIDILREAFGRIGYDINFVEIEWENKDDLLESGEVDCVTGGFTVAGREDGYLWIGPYINSNQVVVVNDSSGISSLSDLEGKAVAVQASGIAENILLERSNPNIPTNIQVYSYEDNSLPFAALGCNYVDALVADEPAVAQYMKDYNTVFTVLEEPILYASVGTAFAKNGDAELCAKANAAIEEMREDGTLEEIITRYLGSADRYLGGDSLER
jgi:polar amino acid transport system substrate-binding protein